jgi:hypothetical protein
MEFYVFYKKIRASEKFIKMIVSMGGYSMHPDERVGDLGLDKDMVYMKKIFMDYILPHLPLF